jgi:hypothetical protein
MTNDNINSPLQIFLKQYLSKAVICNSALVVDNKYSQNIKCMTSTNVLKKILSLQVDINHKDNL